MIKYIRTILFVPVILIFCTSALSAQTYRLRSPDNRFEVSIAVGDSVSYSVTYKKTQIVSPSAISLSLDNTTLGKSGKITKVTNTKVNTQIKPLYGKFSKLSVVYNQIKVDFSASYSIIFRAYNEGVAYRFVTALKDSVTVLNEQATFKLAGNPGAILPETDNYTAWEVPYVRYAGIDTVKIGQRALTPSLFNYADPAIKVIIAEADLLDYPGMYLQKQQNSFVGNFAAYPSATVMGSWGNFVSVVKARQNYIAKTNGTRNYPWRVIIASDDDRSLLTNELIYKLAKPSVLTNTGWIKPGKATWEWWHDAMLPGAGIPSGMGNRNTALYKYYIDFAAKSKLEYLMVDAGWSNNTDVTRINPKVNMKELISYGREKNVGVFLWCVAAPLMKDLDKNLDFIKSLGAVGIKVDFFDRDDQEANQWMEKIAAASARKQLMVNFHGCGKPAGLQRTYPNIVNFEAVRGEECSKWDYTANPVHHLTFPFIRMLGGPLDYTPGSMRNATMETFKPVDPGLPSSLGTRAHELAMYVIFDQPFAMLSDSPTAYEKYPDIMKYLTAVPTVFDDTKVLDAKLGEYAIIAKKKNKEWFVGAMTDWAGREQVIDCSFLSPGITYTADFYSDSEDANTNASGYTYKSIQVTSKDRLKVKLAKGGGAALYIHQ